MKLLKTHQFKGEQLLEMWENKDVKEVKAKKKIIKSLDWDKNYYKKDKQPELQDTKLQDLKLQESSKKSNSNEKNNQPKENKVVLPEPKFKPNLIAVVSKIDTGQSKGNNQNNKNVEKWPVSVKKPEPKENNIIQELKLDANSISKKEEPRKKSAIKQTSLDSNQESLNSFNQETIPFVRQNTIGEKKSFFPNTVRQIYPMVKPENEDQAKQQQAYAPLSRGNSKIDLNDMRRPKSSTLQTTEGPYIKQDTYPKFPQPGTIFTFQNLEINKKLSAISIPNTLNDRTSPDGDESSEKYNEDKF
jgi:hypothetical protein